MKNTTLPELKRHFDCGDCQRTTTKEYNLIAFI